MRILCLLEDIMNYMYTMSEKCQKIECEPSSLCPSPPLKKKGHNALHKCHVCWFNPLLVQLISGEHLKC